MKFTALAVIFAISCFAHFAQSEEGTLSRAEKISSLKNRLLELEKNQKDLDEWYKNFFDAGKGRAVPNLANKISLGGFFETGLININGPNTDNQLVANVHSIGINVGADFSEQLRFVAQTLSVMESQLSNPHNNPALVPSERRFAGITVGSIVAQGFLEYSANDSFNIQSGIGYVPFGIAYQQREPFLYHPRGGPRFIDIDDGFNIQVVSPFWQGLHVFGLFPLTDNTVGYNVYTVSPGTKLRSLGIGGRLWLNIGDQVILGSSAQYGEREVGEYITHGFDVNLKFQNLGLIAEYSRMKNPDGVPDSSSFYIEPYYKFFEDQWLIYVSTEYLNAPNRIDLATGVPDPIETRYHGCGVNWLPISNVRIRLGYLRHDYIKDPANYVDRDFDVVDFSTAIAF